MYTASGGEESCMCFSIIELGNEKRVKSSTILLHYYNIENWEIRMTSQRQRQRQWQWQWHIKKRLIIPNKKKN
ncbi:hypothetical protein PRUPE_1G112000 [Prunus persica]|uniref:Uncharacterized protein n=1 Tax=Prunus persica TaxID=3760 RepID=A0A251QVT3_PRUPE|nr:hypothetical protein PRUPE_1G112000 [Prunus persica]